MNIPEVRTTASDARRGTREAILKVWHKIVRIWGNVGILDIKESKTKYSLIHTLDFRVM